MKCCRQIQKQSARRPRAVEGIERVAGGEADDISLGAAEEEVAARPLLEVESEVLRAAERQPFLRYLG